MNIAQEVFIDNEPNTITYEVGTVWMLDKPADPRCARWVVRRARSPEVPAAARSWCCTASTGCRRRRGGGT